MKKFNSLTAFAVLIAGMGISFANVAGAADAAKPAAVASSPKTPNTNAVVDEEWTERCADKDKAPKKTCEIFTRLQMKDSSMRVAEIAIGFPQDNSLPKGTARGVIILPLGVMLESGATMSVDDGKPFAFKSRFCTQSGCFSFVNMNQDILNSMKKGKQLNIFFKTADNNDAHLILALKGFDKVLDKIEQK